jgi:hypothetical protein
MGWLGALCASGTYAAEAGSISEIPPGLVLEQVQGPGGLEAVVTYQGQPTAQLQIKQQGVTLWERELQVVWQTPNGTFRGTHILAFTPDGRYLFYVIQQFDREIHLSWDRYLVSRAQDGLDVVDTYRFEGLRAKFKSAVVTNDAVRVRCYLETEATPHTIFYSITPVKKIINLSSPKTSRPIIKP